MIQRHKLDAPEELEKEGLTGVADFDHSDFNNLYPQVPIDERPLLMSDDERHQLHDGELQRQISKIRRTFVWTGFQLALPIVLSLYLAAAYVSFGTLPQTRAMMLPIMLVISLIIVGLWIAAYGAILKRFSLHGLSGGAYILTTLLVLVLFIVPLYNLVNVTGSIWFTATGLAGGLMALSILTTFLTLQLATRRASGRK